MTIKLIVGLANPCAEYAATRHNAGAWYVDSGRTVMLPCVKNQNSTGIPHVSILAGADVRLLVPLPPL